MRVEIREVPGAYNRTHHLNAGMICTASHQASMPKRIDPADPTDAPRISMGDDNDFTYRCEELRCSPKQLREIIAKVGNLVADVRARLRQ